MNEKSDSNFPNLGVGDNVRIAVPEVDRCETDAQFIIACAMERTDDDVSELGTQNGVLKQLYARSQFSLCYQKLLNLEGNPFAETTLCSIVK